MFGMNEQEGMKAPEGRRQLGMGSQKLGMQEQHVFFDRRLFLRAFRIIHFEPSLEHRGQWTSWIFKRQVFTCKNSVQYFRGAFLDKKGTTTRAELPEWKGAWTRHMCSVQNSEGKSALRERGKV
eukprot:1159029-Pelagomonas_calceolata.AAC.2